MTKHGGNIYSYNNSVIDFSANISPLGVHSEILEAIKNSDVSVYPDCFCKKLRSGIAKKENVDCENIICGNGAAEIIYNIVTVLKPKKVLFIEPTFSEYENACDVVGSEKIYYFLKEENDFKLDENILNYIKNVDMLFLCNPNNPTGKAVSKEIVLKIADKCLKENVFFVIDECFMDFADIYTMADYINTYKNIVVLKAFTKMYAIPGLRLGYCLTSNKELITKIYNNRQPWSVSKIAQDAGNAALLLKDIPEKTRKYIENERKYLELALDKFDIKYYKSCVNFILFKENKDFDKKLLNYNILIRNCDNFIGLNNNEFSYYRIAVKKHTENEMLFNAIKKIKEGEL